MKNTIIKVLSVMMAMVFAFGSCVIAVAAEDAEAVVTACEHANATVYAKVAETCTTWGYTLYSCPDCGEYFTKDNINEFIPPHNVNYGESSTRVKPTCSDVQHVLYTCDYCGATRREDKGTTTNPNAHVWGEWDITESTCTADGVKTRECTLCGKVETEALATDGHDWVADEQRVTAPTCQATGLMPYYCATCGATKTVIILECDHMYEKKDAIKGDCGVQGRNEGRYCIWCGEADPTDDNAGYPELKQHDFQKVEGTYVAPDCENDGYYTGKCANCGVEMDVTADEDEALLALGHNWGDAPVWTIEATCTANGYKFYGCTRDAAEMRDGKPCSATYTELIPALGHDMQPAVDANGDPIKTDATCTEPGGYKLACSRCPYTGADDNYEVIEPLGHDTYEVEAVAPTCTTAGNTAGVKCTRCDYDTTTEIPATNHANTKQYYICTVEGLRDVYCTACGEALEEGEKVTLDPETTENHIMGAFDENDNHVLGAFATLVEPTCTTQGLEAQYCKYCDKIFTRTIQALGHDQVVEELAATCVAGGHYNVTCARCDEILEEGTYDIDPDAHVSVITEKTDATCTADGVEKGECQLCGAKYTKVLPATGHTNELVKGYDATCEDAGRTDGVKCSVCDAWIVEPEDILALGHTKNEFDQLDPTCTEAGYTAGWECTVCGKAVGGVEIPATGHAYTSTVAKEASCANGGQIGYTYNVCTNCGDEYIDNYKYAPKHVWGDEQVVEVTCGNDGYKYKECSVCGEKDIYDVVVTEGHKNANGDVISTACNRGDLTAEEITCVYCEKEIAVAHNYEFDREVLADCITYHHNIMVCTICGDEDVEVLGGLDADNHDWVTDYENTDRDPLVSEYEYKKTCARCGATDNKLLDEIYKVEFVTDVVNSSTVDPENPVDFVNGSHRTNNRLLVNVYLKGAEGTKINSAKFDFVFKTDAIELANVIASDIVDKDELVYNNTNGKIIILYARSNKVDENGNKVVDTLELNNEKQLLVTLEFKIKDSFYGANETYKTLTPGSISNITLIDADKNEVKSKSGATTDSVRVYKRGELTGEAAGLINNADLTAMLYYLANGTYDVRADLDLDGTVNSRDYLLMRDWIIEKVIYPSNTK